MEIRPIARPVGPVTKDAGSRLPSDRFMEAVHEQRRQAQRKAGEKAGAVDPAAVPALPGVSIAVATEQVVALSLNPAVDVSPHVDAMSHVPLTRTPDVPMEPGQREVHPTPAAPAMPVPSDAADGIARATVLPDVSPAVRVDQDGVSQQPSVVTDAPRVTDLPGTARVVTTAEMSGYVRASGVPERAMEPLPEQRTASQAGTPLLTPPHPVGGDGGTTSQAQHTEVHSLKQQEHRAQQREAASLQASLGRSGSASAAFSYAFSSWGSDHLVRVQLGATRTTVQGSSTQVEEGLRRAEALAGIDVIGLDAGSDGADPDGQRRGRGRREQA